MDSVICLVLDDATDMQEHLLISKFCRVSNVVCFLLGNSPASEFCMPTFWNTLSVPPF
jgi:hypothetical protein